jgi:hypothetical protein
MYAICAIILRRLIDLGWLFILVSLILITNWLWLKCHKKSSELENPDDAVNVSLDIGEFTDISF